MEARLDYARKAPAIHRAMVALSQAANNSGLEHSLLELIKTRASQINGCAYCVDMHTKDARAAGETEQRLYLLSAWHEAPFYSDRERAALAWTEAVTLVGETHVPDALYEETLRHFSEEELVQLTWASWPSTPGTGSRCRSARRPACISRRTRPYEHADEG